MNFLLRFLTPYGWQPWPLAATLHSCLAATHVTGSITLHSTTNFREQIKTIIIFWHILIKQQQQKNAITFLQDRNSI